MVIYQKTQILLNLTFLDLLCDEEGDQDLLYAATQYEQKAEGTSKTDAQVLLPIENQVDIYQKSTTT